MSLDLSVAQAMQEQINELEKRVSELERAKEQAEEYAREQRELSE
jgi:hypothetical protein